MTLHVEQVTDADAAGWDAFVDRSNEGTLFHRLGFLAYHGDRFAGMERPLAFRSGDELYAVLPLAISEEDGRRMARSPYGGTYGGPAFRTPPRYHEAHDWLDALAVWLKGEGVEALSLTLPIAPCHHRYSETFRMVLEQRGAILRNRVISSVIDLQEGADLAARFRPRARRGARKAEKLGVSLRFGAPVEDFWQVLEQTYEKHGSPPTHSREEWTRLEASFPDHVASNVAYLDGRPVAAIGCMRVHARVLCSFYLCSDPAYRDSQALSALVVGTLQRARQEGIACFDFGMTRRKVGYEFKENFGTSGVMRDSYLLPIADYPDTPWEDILDRPAWDLPGPDQLGS